MTDQQINYIGFAIMALLFWYVQIYRPRKKLKNPGALMINKVMGSREKEVYDSLKVAFPDPFILKSNVCFDDLLFSPDLNKKQHFHKAMRQMFVSWLVLDENLTPVLAVDFTNFHDDEMKMSYLTHAGVGCCIFAPTASAEEIRSELKEARFSLESIVDEAPSQPA